MFTPPSQATTKVLLSLGLVASLSLSLQAQTIDDAIMLRGRELQTGNLYSHDSWDQYWEGTVKRTNGNIGRITTDANVVTANYGLHDRLNVIAMVPYVWTNASQGVLHGIQGFQDLTLAAKWNFLDKPWTSQGALRAFLVVSGGLPMTNYNPELLPLSIGMGSTRVSWRGTLNFQSNPGWFLTSTTAYTWRSEVALDRPYFVTDDEFVMSDHVDMPNVLDTTASAGYMKRRPDDRRLVHEAEHPGWRRHPAAGHAVRVQQHGLLQGRRDGDAPHSQASAPGVPLRAGTHVRRPERG